jgi:hypothetical protein
VATLRASGPKRADGNGPSGWWRRWAAVLGGPGAGERRPRRLGLSARAALRCRPGTARSECTREQAGGPSKQGGPRLVRVMALVRRRQSRLGQNARRRVALAARLGAAHRDAVAAAWRRQA